MRQRRVRGIEEKLAVYSDLILRAEGEFSEDLVCDPLRYTRWYQRRSELFVLPDGFGRVYAEFGCGRGLFINALAEKDTDGLYIGIEGCKTIVYQAVKKTGASALRNLFYIDEFINDAKSAFSENSLDGIFLNFSDPWPKDRHADRRLTAPDKAKSYLSVLKPGGFAALKTDNEPFFDYSLEVFMEAGYAIEYSTRNLSEQDGFSALAGLSALISGAAATGMATQTEYEQKFRALGQQIYYFLARIR